MILRPNDQLKLEWSASVRHPFGGKEHKIKEMIEFKYEEVVAALQFYREHQAKTQAKTAAKKAVQAAPAGDTTASAPATGVFRLTRSIGSIRAGSPQRAKILGDMLDRLETIPADERTKLIDSHRDSLAEIASADLGIKPEIVDRLRNFLVA